MDVLPIKASSSPTSIILPGKFIKGFSQVNKLGSGWVGPPLTRNYFFFEILRFFVFLCCFHIPNVSKKKLDRVV